MIKTIELLNHYALIEYFGKKVDPNEKPNEALQYTICYKVDTVRLVPKENLMSDKIYTVLLPLEMRAVVQGINEIEATPPWKTNAIEWDA